MQAAAMGPKAQAARKRRAEKAAQAKAAELQRKAAQALAARPAPAPSAENASRCRAPRALNTPLEDALAQCVSRQSAI